MLTLHHVHYNKAHGMTLRRITLHCIALYAITLGIVFNWVSDDHGTYRDREGRT